jgi:hypothetical protein
VGLARQLARWLRKEGRQEGGRLTRGGERDVRVDREEGRLTRRSFGREVGGAVDKEGGRSYN